MGGLWRGERSTRSYIAPAPHRQAEPRGPAPWLLRIRCTGTMTRSTALGASPFSDEAASKSDTVRTIRLCPTAWNTLPTLRSLITKTGAKQPDRIARDRRFASLAYPNSKVGRMALRKGAFALWQPLRQNQSLQASAWEPPLQSRHGAPESSSMRQPATERRSPLVSEDQAYSTQVNAAPLTGYNAMSLKSRPDTSLQGLL